MSHGESRAGKEGREALTQGIATGCVRGHGAQTDREGLQPLVAAPGGANTLRLRRSKAKRNSKRSASF
jgi:hypothetical protein